MIKVITYGTYDMFHYGHRRLLERAKALGDYLIVGVTSDGYDIERGKINLQQTLTERIEVIRETGLADLIIVEEYEGQKIDDIKRYNVDVFAIGSDWQGRFDYLKEYCNVVYLPRTEGVSSSLLRTEDRKIRMGFIGDGESRILNKYFSECQFVNGAEVSGVCTADIEVRRNRNIKIVDDYEELLNSSDAVYIVSHPSQHYHHIKKALKAGKHALVELPIVLTAEHYEELSELADNKEVIMMPAMKTAYATAYNRLLLLIKGGKIGKVVSVDATCTSIREVSKEEIRKNRIWNSICAWGPTALLPVFQILGTSYYKADIISKFISKKEHFDAFTKIDFVYSGAVASIKVGRSAKSEGDLVVTGTEGYFYVPAPWWKTDYFELRCENAENNRRYYYQLDGEGIRYELVAFIKAIKSKKQYVYIDKDISVSITKLMEEFYKNNVMEIQ